MVGAWIILIPLHTMLSKYSVGKCARLCQESLALLLYEATRGFLRVTSMFGKMLNHLNSPTVFFQDEEQTLSVICTPCSRGFKSLPHYWLNCSFIHVGPRGIRQVTVRQLARIFYSIHGRVKPAQMFWFLLKRRFG